MGGFIVAHGIPWWLKPNKNLEKLRMGAVGVAKDIYLEKFGLDATTFSLLVPWHLSDAESTAGCGEVRVSMVLVTFGFDVNNGGSWKLVRNNSVGVYIDY